MASRGAEGAELNRKRFVLIVDVVSSGAIFRCVQTSKR
jgi:hypothetical protein